MEDWRLEISKSASKHRIWAQEPGTTHATIVAEIPTYEPFDPDLSNQQLAGAKLIAAAPSMLDALEEISMLVHWDEVSMAVSIAKHAIKKATE